MLVLAHSSAAHAGDKAGSAELRFAAGWASAGAALEGAHVRLYDLSGHPLKNGRAVTFQTGTFSIEGKLPKDFLVKVSRGTVAGMPFDGDLRAIVTGFDPRKDIIYVNPVTTLQAAWLEAHPKDGIAKARAAVNKFFGVPEDADLAAMGGRGNFWFDDGRFVLGMGTAGSPARFLAQLRGELLNGSTHPFPRVSAEAGANPDGGRAGAGLLDWASGKLTEGVGEIGKSAFAYALKKAGFPMEPGMSDIKAELDQISQQLAALSQQMDRMQQDLSCQIQGIGYGDKADAYIKDLEEVRLITQHMNVMLASAPNSDAQKNYQKLVRQGAGQNLSLHTRVNKFALGDSALSLSGAVRGLSQQLRSCGNFLNATKSAALVRQYDYLSGLQVQACQIVINYYTDADMTDMAKTVANECQQYFKDLKAMAIQQLPAGTTDSIDFRTGLMWKVGPYLNSIVLAPSCRGGGCVQRHPAQHCGYEDAGDYGDIFYCNTLYAAPVGSVMAGTDSRWRLPMNADLQGFTQGCLSGDTEAMKRCMAHQGWGSDSTHSFYEGGWFIAWTAGDTRSRGDYSFGYYAFDGSVHLSNTTDNSGRVLMVRPLDSGERYWN